MQKSNKREGLFWALAMLLVAAAALAFVGWQRGWLGGSAAQPALVQQCQGLAQLERGGLSAAAQQGASLQAGDLLTTGEGAQLTVAAGGSRLVLLPGSALEITQAETTAFSAALRQGAAYIQAAQPGLLCTAAGRSLEFPGGQAWLSPQALQVLSGQALCAGQTVAAGQALALGQADAPPQPLTAEMLSDALLAQLLSGDGSEVCFTAQQLESEQARRAAEAQANLEQQLAPASSSPQQPDSEAPAPEPEVPSPASEPASTAPQSAAQSTAPAQSEAAEPEPPPAAEPEPPAQPPAVSFNCTISIRCDTILANPDALKPEKAGYVPANGVLLAVTTVSCTEGESVLSVLQRACEAAGLSLAQSSGYVQSIGQLAERDCGPLSGWMYSVNGVFPSYGCASYTVQQGDSILWQYTCNGLGADLRAEGP